MSWDVGYTGDCPRCGASVHHLAEDKAGMTALWMRCPACRRADSEQVPDGRVAEFWRAPHPCPACGTARERWAPSSCARCGQENAGRYVCEPD